MRSPLDWLTTARRLARLGVLLLFGVAAVGCGERDDAPAVVLKVFAAASTADALTELSRLYEQQRPGVRVRGNFAGSSTLARQLVAGAEAHIYLAANPDWMDHVEEAGVIEPASRVDLLGNELVLAAGAAAEPEEVTALRAGGGLADTTGRIALADPSHVPAGLYARQALASLGWWEAAEPRTIAAVDVRSALRLVKMGEAAWGMVYATDARAVDDIVVVLAISPRRHDPIVYPAALGAGAPEEARAFLDFMRSEAAAAVFARHGFTVRPMSSD
jgi:molybdate transport system substrate-binding protein